MCLIIHSPTGKLVERDVFDYAQRVNSDGIGIMSVYGVEKFVGRKCKKRAWRYLRQLLLVHPDTPYGVHFRWATHGDVNRHNTHPFAAPMSDAYVMHNGIIGMTMNEATREKSDTAVFVEQYMMFAPDQSDQDYDMYFQRIARMIGAENKFLILHAQTGRFTLVNEDSGFWYEGFWYSNEYSVPNHINPYGGNRSISNQWWNRWEDGYPTGREWTVGQQDGTYAQCTVDTTKGIITLPGKPIYNEPTVNQYLAMTPAEQEYADSMVTDRMTRAGYYDDIERTAPKDYYDTGADVGGTNIVTGEDIDDMLEDEREELMCKIMEQDERAIEQDARITAEELEEDLRYYRYMERKARERGAA